MAAIIIHPAWTGEMIVQVLDRLVESEIRKNLTTDSFNSIATQEGYQDGYLQCLADLIGKTDEVAMIHLVRKIVSSDFSGKKTLKVMKVLKTAPFGLDSEAIKMVISRYVQENTREVLEAIRGK